jgi:hypothetical protein
MLRLYKPDLALKASYLVLPKKANHAELIKTVAENWNSKAPSVGTILVYLETTA